MNNVCVCDVDFLILFWWYFLSSGDPGCCTMAPFLRIAFSSYELGVLPPLPDPPFCAIKLKEALVTGEQLLLWAAANHLPPSQHPTAHILTVSSLLMSKPSQSGLPGFSSNTSDVQNCWCSHAWSSPAFTLKLNILILSLPPCCCLLSVPPSQHCSIFFHSCWWSHFIFDTVLTAR